MEYMSAHEAANKWGITKRRVQILCASNRVKDAVRVGNMWIIPSNAEKPADGRIKEEKATEDKLQKNPIRAARNRIRSLTNDGMQTMLSAGISHDEAKLSLVSLFASELLNFYISKSGANAKLSDIRQTVEKTVGYPTVEFEGNDMIRSDIRDFLVDNPFCCDDALAWSYQYANKAKSGALYSNTQFFTEKYMITTLVDSLELVKRKKVLDPACGGGNFLLYCLDILGEHISCTDKATCKKALSVALSKLNGYEIDTTLALVASFNMRLKCLALLADYGYSVDVKDFESFIPNIYYPEDKTLSGALDITKSNVHVCKAGTEEPFETTQIFNEIDVLITNPPFQTIKGMPDPLKAYLKKYYPKAKCDMCNAFIELSYNLLIDGGVAGLVTQNSWMYLDSFEELRQTLLISCSIDHIWELGSNAFYDLSGEKSNVALLLYKKAAPTNGAEVKLTSLKSLDLAVKEGLLASKRDTDEHTKTLLQQDIYENDGSRFDMISSVGLRNLLLSGDKYEEYAVPMQGTSTGNAKELIDYYWKHIGDNEWVLVSKGGGYSRWCGLNHYCVKWGHDGEYIKATKGSAIRNASYFSQTQMVFSDTGTSGLNVRELLPKQIFVASGPGIRIKTGKTNAHLAFLNSRLTAYYVRLLSPKLTIAAGYIAKVPTHSNILQSEQMNEYGKRCLDAKKHRLTKRACNVEFTPVSCVDPLRYEEMAYRWFLEDIEDEWTQLQYEHKIDEYITTVMSLSKDDLLAIDNAIGPKRVFAFDSSESVNLQELEKVLDKFLDSNCNILRTKVEKRSIGCDGILEFLSQKFNVSCEYIYRLFSKERYYPTILKKRYESFYLHAIILSALGYPNKPCSLSAEELARKIAISDSAQFVAVQDWIMRSFNHIHADALMNAPVFEYVQTQNSIFYRKEGENE